METWEFFCDLDIEKLFIHLIIRNEMILLGLIL